MVQGKGGGVIHWNFKGYKSVTATMINGIRRHAVGRNLECPLLDRSIQSYEYLHSIITTHCPLSGVPLVFQPASRSRERGTISLDRIDSAKGYIEGNVRWVHKIVNRMRWDLTDKEFLGFIHDIVKTHPKPVS